MLFEDYALRVDALNIAVQTALKAKADGVEGDDLAPFIRAVRDAEWVLNEASRHEPRDIETHRREVSAIRWQTIQATFKRGWKSCDRLVIEQEGNAPLPREKRPLPNAARVAEVYGAFSELRALLEDPAHG